MLATYHCIHTFVCNNQLITWMSEFSYRETCTPICTYIVSSIRYVLTMACGLLTHRHLCSDLSSRHVALTIIMITRIAYICIVIVNIKNQLNILNNICNRWNVSLAILSLGCSWDPNSLELTPLVIIPIN